MTTDYTCQLAAAQQEIARLTAENEQMKKALSTAGRRILDYWGVVSDLQRAQGKFPFPPEPQPQYPREPVRPLDMTPRQVGEMVWYEAHMVVHNATNPERVRVNWVRGVDPTDYEYRKQVTKAMWVLQHTPNPFD